MQTIAEKEKATVILDSRIDINNTQEIESQIKVTAEKVNKLILDFKNVEYMSSIGLRMLFELQKIMKQHGEMELTNVNDDIMNILNMTGFSGILTIKE